MSSHDRPPLVTADTLDATQLSGQLDMNGFASLKANHSNGSVKADGNPAVQAAGLEPADRDESPDSSEGRYEDYDTQRLHPDTIVPGSTGGKLEVNLEDSRRQKPGLPSRRGSIPVRLEKTDRKGRYLLTADDPDIKDIIKNGFARQNFTERISSSGPKLRELVFTRRFTTFDRQNPSNTESPFLGFYVLFWIAMAFLLLRVAVHNHRVTGSVLGENQLMKMMFSREIISLGLTDGLMFLSTALGWCLQIIIHKGYLSWNRSGWILQNLWQTFYLGAIVGWTFYRDWPWTHTIFVVLHGLVFIMKQHSYAFYNGYLSQVYKRRKHLERYLGKLNAMAPVSSPVSSPKAERNNSFTTPDSPNNLRHRRHKSTPGSPEKTNLSTESQEVASVSAALNSDNSLDSDQMDAFRGIISTELEALDEELRGKCSISQNYYPSNLTLFNWAEWTCMPTLVYELEYPRQDKINWGYVAEKTGAIFGVLIIMQTISQAFIYPPMKEAFALKERGISLEERWQEFPYLVLDMLFPLLLEQLLTWYLIWECVLNVLAELTYFADRGFYGNWWSS